MAQVNVNVRMDSELKKTFEALCNDMGLTMTTAINVFAKKVVKECRIPFEISTTNPNATLREAIAEGRKLAYDKSVAGYDNMTDLRRSLEV